MRRWSGFIASASMIGATLGFVACKKIAATDASLLHTAVDDATRGTADEMAMRYVREDGKRDPEGASSNGLQEFDPFVGDLNADPEPFYRQWIKTLDDAIDTSPPQLGHELTLIRRNIETNLKLETTKAQGGYVSFFGDGDTGIAFIYGGLDPLLSAQFGNERTKDALKRFERYVKGDADRQIEPLLVAQRKILEKEAGDPQAVFPFEDAVKSYLEDEQSNLEGVETLLAGTKLSGWQASYQTLRQQSAEFSQFVRQTILPRARKQPALDRERYRAFLQLNGVDATPEDLIRMAEADFLTYAAELKELATAVAKKHKLPNSDIRSVADALRRSAKTMSPQQTQSFTLDLVREIAGILKAKDLMTVPDITPIVRLATKAEYASSTVPYVNTGAVFATKQVFPEYVLPLPKGVSCKDNELCAQPLAFTLTAHEVMPGHVFQYTLNMRSPAPLSRRFFSDNAAASEGWAVYCEDMLRQQLPPDQIELRFGSVMSITHRIARAFLDPKLQLNQISKEEILRVLTDEVGLTADDAEEEYKRYSWNDIGQATSYYYGMKRIQQTKERLKQERNITEREFHDAYLRLGVVPINDLYSWIKRELGGG